MNVKVCGLIEGLMVCWDEVNNAAAYHVHLLIGETTKENKKVAGRVTSKIIEKTNYKEIAIVDVDRNYKYYSFKGLARIHVSYEWGIHGRTKHETGSNYYIVVEAEDRQGKIIDSSDKVLGKVLSVDNGFANEG